MTDVHVTAPAPAQGRQASAARRWGLLGLALVFLLITVLGGALFGGYQAGLEQRDSSWQATRTYELDHQYELGLDDLANGRYEVAAARFEYVLQLDPGHPAAGQKLAEARAGLGGAPTPSPDPTAAPAPTARPTATAGTPQAGEAAGLLEEARQLFAAGDWDGVIHTLARLHSVDPDYEAVRADGLLYRALRNRGVDRIQGDAMEAGIFDLDTAEAFGPIDNEASNLRAWARIYLAGRSYWGLDWKRSMDIFEELSLSAPYFRDTDRRLFTAVVNYADQLAAAGDFCGAAERYERALLVRADEAVAVKLTTAQEQCGAAPPPEDGAPPEEEGTPDA